MKMNFRPKMVMPFGKYRGSAVEDLPIAYVEWLLSEVHLDPVLEKELQNQLALKQGRGVLREKAE